MVWRCPVRRLDGRRPLVARAERVRARLGQGQLSAHAQRQDPRAHRVVRSGSRGRSIRICPRPSPRAPDLPIRPRPIAVRPSSPPMPPPATPGLDFRGQTPDLVDPDQSDERTAPVRRAAAVTMEGPPPNARFRAVFDGGSTPNPPLRAPHDGGSTPNPRSGAAPDDINPSTLSELRRRSVEPTRACRLDRGRGGRRSPLQPALHLRQHAWPRQDALDAYHRPPRSTGSGRARASSTSPQKALPTTSSPPSSTIGWTRFTRATAQSATCCWSTTSSSSRVAKELGKFFHTFNALHASSIARSWSPASKYPPSLGAWRSVWSRFFSWEPGRRRPDAGAGDARGDRAQQGRARRLPALERATWRSSSPR